MSLETLIVTINCLDLVVFSHLDISFIILSEEQNGCLLLIEIVVVIWNGIETILEWIYFDTATYDRIKEILLYKKGFITEPSTYFDGIIFKNTKLLQCTFLGGYICNVYGKPCLCRKNTIFCNHFYTKYLFSSKHWNIFVK